MTSYEQKKEDLTVFFESVEKPMVFPTKALYTRVSRQSATLLTLAKPQGVGLVVHSCTSVAYVLFF